MRVGRGAGGGAAACVWGWVGVCVRGCRGGRGGKVYEVGRWGGVRREGYKGLTLSSSVRLLTIVHLFHDGNRVSYCLLPLHLVVRVWSVGLPTR